MYMKWVNQNQKCVAQAINFHLQDSSSSLIASDSLAILQPFSLAQSCLWDNIRMVWYWEGSGRELNQTNIFDGIRRDIRSGIELVAKWDWDWDGLMWITPFSLVLISQFAAQMSCGDFEDSVKCMRLDRPEPEMCGSDDQFSLTLLK